MIIILKTLSIIIKVIVSMIRHSAEHWWNTVARLTHAYPVEGFVFIFEVILYGDVQVVDDVEPVPFDSGADNGQLSLCMKVIWRK